MKPRRLAKTKIFLCPITGSVRWVHGILTQGWSTARLRGRRHRCSVPAHRYVCLLAIHFLETKRRLSAHSLPSSHETALMLDRLISINDRIPLSPCVNLPLCHGQTAERHPSFFFPFSFGFFFSLYRDPMMINGLPYAERASRVSILRPYRRFPSSTISGVSSASLISRCVLSFLAYPSFHPPLPSPRSPLS